MSLQYLLAIRVYQAGCRMALCYRGNLAEAEFQLDKDMKTRAPIVGVFVSSYTTRVCSCIYGSCRYVF